MPQRTSGRNRSQPQKPPPVDAVQFERQEQIDELVETVRKEERFAFDTEFVMEDRYEPEVCLIQIATERMVALIDPFRELDLDPIWSLVSDPEVEVLVHAGQEDLALCVQHTGKLPVRVFDVQVAAGLVGTDFPLSLQKLVQRFLHIRLHKSKTLTDWRRRPLTVSQLQYAAEDVCYLIAIQTKVMADLNRRGRMDWAREEFAGFEEETLYGHVEEEKLRRVKGTASMDGRQLATVRSLLHWRDELASKLDRPPRVVLKDHLLVEIAKHAIASYGEIRELRGINLSDKNIRGACEVVEAALALPEDQWPHPAPREKQLAQEEVLVPLLTAVLKAYCLENRLAYSLVATKKTIHELIVHHLDGSTESSSDTETPALLRGWREKTAGHIASEVLTGKRSIRVQKGRIVDAQ